MNNKLIYIAASDNSSSVNLVSIITPLGFKCVCVNSMGPDVYEQINITKPDLILIASEFLSDLNTAEFVKSVEHENTFPIIYLTSASDENLLASAGLKDQYALLLNPINEKELKTLINAALDKHESSMQLAESEERFKIISKMTLDFIFCVSIDSCQRLKLEWSNTGFFDEMGFTIDSLLSKDTWKNHVYYEDHNAFQNSYEMVKAGTETKTEARLIKSSGDLCWFSIEFKPASDTKTNQASKYYGKLQNINTQKKAEQKLKQSNDTFEIRVQEKTSQLEKIVNNLKLEVDKGIKIDKKLHESQNRHRVFVETSTEGISLIEINPPIPLYLTNEQKAEHYYENAFLAECNLTFARMYGYNEPSEIVGKKYKSFFVENKQTIIQSIIPLFSSELPILDQESMEVDKDGNVVYFLNNAAMVIDNDCIIQIWGSQRDITETKKRNKQIQLQAKLLDSVSDSIFLINQNGKIIYSNEIGYTSRGYTKDEFEGFHVEMLNDETFRTKVTNRIQTVFENGFIFFETIHVRKDGSSFPVEINGQLIEFENEKYILSVNRDITERKNHQEKLRESETKYRLIAENTKDIIWTAGLNLKITYISPSVKAITGFTQEEVYKSSIKDQVTPESYNKAMTMYRDILEMDSENQIPNDFSISIELDQFCKDGTVIPTESVLSFIRNEENSPSAIIGITRDISERKKTERAIKQSEEKFSKAFYTSPDAVSINRLKDGVYLEINQGFSVLTGYKPEEIIGHSSIELSIWYNIEDRNKLVKELSVNGKVENFPARFRLKDGSIRSGLMSAQLLELSGSTCILNIVRDVTKIKLAEEEIFKLSRAVEYSPAAIIITDSKGVIEYINPKFTEITGYTSSEAIGNTPRILKSGKQPNELYNSLWKTILAGNEWRGEMHNKKKNGEFYWEYDSISSIKDEGGRIKNFLAIKEDISEQKRLLNDIIKAKEEAEEANKVKSSLLANMSHEFRTPLNGILGFAQLLKEEIKEETNIEMVEKIRSSGKRLMNTLNGVLTLTELENEDYLIQQNEIDLTFFCQQIKTLFDSSALTKGLNFSADLPFEEIIVNTDEILLTKIISNIVDNAFKYTHHGGIIIRLLKCSGDKNNGRVCIKVIDTGIGIKQEDLPVIFREFRQLSEGFRRDYEGLGIGLTLSKRMASLIGIEIEVESEVGVGTQFSVSIPYKNPNIDFIQSDIKTSDYLVISDPKEKSEKMLEILIVEDNPLNIEVVQRFLSKIGRVYAARDGETALSMAENNYYDLMLVDINLGHGIDGIEVLKGIRKHSKYKNTPIIALTGYASEMHKRDFLKHGFTGYLPKPFEKKVLLKVVNEIT